MVSVSTTERNDTHDAQDPPTVEDPPQPGGYLCDRRRGVGGTFANFTATPTTISSNAFASGSLSMTRTGSGAIFNASALKIGDSVTGSVTITNTGTLARAYSLAGSSSGCAALTSQLNLKVYKDCRRRQRAL